jgi:short-subunit dehydrogenase
MNFSVIRNADTELGNAIAIALAALGRHLILLGRDSIMLERIGKNLRTHYQVRVFSILAEDHSTQSIINVCEVINNDFQVDLFVNYTEIDFYGKFIDRAIHKLDMDLRTNYISGPIYTHQLLPNLMLHANAYVLNLYLSYVSKPSQWTTILRAQNISFSNYLSEDMEDSGVIVKACNIEMNDMKGSINESEEYSAIAKALLNDLFHHQDVTVLL